MHACKAYGAQRASATAALMMAYAAAEQPATSRSLARAFVCAACWPVAAAGRGGGGRVGPAAARPGQRLGLHHVTPLWHAGDGGGGGGGSCHRRRAGPGRQRSDRTSASSKRRQPGVRGACSEGAALQQFQLLWNFFLPLMAMMLASWQTPPNATMAACTRLTPCAGWLGWAGLGSSLRCGAHDDGDVMR